MKSARKDFHTEAQSHRGSVSRGETVRPSNFLARFARRPSLARLRTQPGAEKELCGSVALCESPSSSKRRGEHGYTLMELLVVIAILGLLTSIGTVMVLRYLDSAKFGTAKTEVQSYTAALDLFKLDVGRYPTTDEGLQALVKAPATAENWNGPYMKVTNLNDPWGHPFQYRSPGEHGEFDIYSYGPKGKEGSGDAKPAVANWQ